MHPGEIYRHDAFYRDPETGTLEPKYLVLLATLPSDDLVARLLTSRPHGRREQPPAFTVGRTRVTSLVYWVDRSLPNHGWICATRMTLTKSNPADFPKPESPVEFR